MEEPKVDDFQSIIELFEEDLGSPLELAVIDLNRLFLKGYSDEMNNELMLRLNSERSELIVARIQFIHQRQGYCQRLLQLLTEYGKNHHYQWIVFEGVLSEPMLQFVKKHGFQLASDKEYEMNWKRKI